MAKTPMLGNIKSLQSTLSTSASPKKVGNNKAHFSMNDAMNGPGTDHAFFPMSDVGPAKRSSK